MGIDSLFDISASAMDAQSMRLRVIAENLANQDTTGSTPGADPYRRKTVTFRDAVNDAGTPLVEVASVGHDNSDFALRYDPSHPAANPDGYVKTSNVNSFVEMMDMREAERSYSANLNVMQMTRGMLNRTIDLLK